MTANQIAYARHREDARHNRMTERAGFAQAKASMLQAQAAGTQAAAAKLRQSEELRHNQQTEAINWFVSEQTAQLQQAQRELAIRDAASHERQAEAAYRSSSAALAQAAAQQSAVAESIRHNLSVENETRRFNIEQMDQQALRNSIQSAYNVASITEQQRHNAAVEGVQQQGAISSYMQARAALQQAESAKVRAGAAVTSAEAAQSQAGAAWLRSGSQAARTAFDIAQNLLGGFSNGKKQTKDQGKVDDSYFWSLLP